MTDCSLEMGVRKNPLCFRLALSEYFIAATERGGREKVFLRSLVIPATMRFLDLWNCFVVSMWKSLEPRAKKKSTKMLETDVSGAFWWVLIRQECVLEA